MVAVARPAPTHSPVAGSKPDAATLRALARELDAIGKRVRAELDESDLAHIVAIDRTARGLTAAGRALIYVGFDPVTLSLGILALAAGKQLDLIEVCHAVLHGAYDRFDHPRLHSQRVTIDAPLHTASWRDTHAHKHHPHANVVGRDPDARFGVLRQNPLVPFRPHHRWQLLSWLSNGIGLTGHLNLMVTGVADVYMRSREDSYTLDDRSPIGVIDAHRRALSAALPYYLKNFVAIPALAGPFALKVLLANAAAELLRNLYTAATVYSGHISADHAVFPADTQPETKGEWYWMQAVASANFEVPRALSLLCGGLDNHIEHHFFPRLPPERIRAIVPEVRAVCERHGVPYKTARWPRVLANVARQFLAMSRKPRA